MAITNAQLLKTIESLRDDDLAEIKAKLDLLNGRQRETEQSQASILQWRHDFESTCGKTKEYMREDIQKLRDRTNLWSSMLSLGELAIAAVLAALFGNKP